MLTAVEDSSQIASARRAARDCAREAGLDENTSSRIALVATEMASNLLKHAGRGEIVVDTFANGVGLGVELISLDKGPGIRDVGSASRDGVSTSGTPGTGLGAMRRQSDDFAIWSQPGLGTAIVTRFGRGSALGPVVGAVVCPYPGEPISGDGWRLMVTKKGPSLLMVDGSGHGWHASLAVKAAAKVFEENSGLDPVAQMQAIHRALAPTRGAAVAIAAVDTSQRMVHFVGVGNIAGAVLAGGTVKRMVSHPGTAGHIARKIAEFTYPCEPGAAIAVHSDGLSARWDVDHYPGLAASHPSLIAGVLFRDHRRTKDDASVAVLRLAS